MSTINSINPITSTSFSSKEEKEEELDLEAILNDTLQEMGIQNEERPSEITSPVSSQRSSIPIPDLSCETAMDSPEFPDLSCETGMDSPESYAMMCQFLSQNPAFLETLVNKKENYPSEDEFIIPFPMECNGSKKYFKINTNDIKKIKEEFEVLLDPFREGGLQNLLSCIFGKEELGEKIGLKVQELISNGTMKEVMEESVSIENQNAKEKIIYNRSVLEDLPIDEEKRQQMASNPSFSFLYLKSYMEFFSKTSHVSEFLLQGKDELDIDHSDLKEVFNFYKNVSPTKSEKCKSLFTPILLRNF